MDIRTKLVFALVGTALGSMILLGTVMVRQADGDLEDARRNQLEGLADAKAEALEQVFSGWSDRVSLIASRTQLRLSLQRFNESRDPEELARISRILQDALEAVDVVESLAVYDLSDSLVASVGTGPDPGTSVPLPPSVPVSEHVFYQGVTAAGGRSLRVGFLANLFVDDERQGNLLIRLNAEPILDLIENPPGLIGGGEMLVLTKDGNGTPRVLRRSATGESELWTAVDAGDPESLFGLALSHEDHRALEILDDHGKLVWAEIRDLPEAQWGLVVKLDEYTGREPARIFRAKVTDLAQALAAFAIVMGAILGIRFAKPIHDLALTANRIKKGELSARASVSGEDEVGFLARTFNQMAEELEQQVSLLREFQRYFDVSLDMLCIAGGDGFFKRVNPAFQRTLGWSTQDLLSRSFLEFVHKDDLEKTQLEIQKLTQGIPTISFENRYRCTNGSYKYLAWTAQPDEETGLIYAIARDVTHLREERRWAAKRIEALNRRLQEAKLEMRGRS
jgi:PAS domain S-box-containing protein